MQHRLSYLIGRMFRPVITRLERFFVIASVPDLISMLLERMRWKDKCSQGKCHGILFFVDACVRASLCWLLPSVCVLFKFFAEHKLVKYTLLLQEPRVGPWSCDSIYAYNHALRRTHYTAVTEIVYTFSFAPHLNFSPTTSISLKTKLNKNDCPNEMYVML